MAIGVTRYYQVVLNDDFKHNCIQFLAGEHPSMQKPYGIRHILDQELSSHKKLYTEQQNLQISILTWNCAGNPPPSSDWDISDVIIDERNMYSDIFVVGLQEMVNLKVKEVLQKKDKKRSQLWESLIQNALNKNPTKVKYIPII